MKHKLIGAKMFIFIQRVFSGVKAVQPPGSQDGIIQRLKTERLYQIYRSAFRLFAGFRLGLLPGAFFLAGGLSLFCFINFLE